MCPRAPAWPKMALFLAVFKTFRHNRKNPFLFHRNILHQDLPCLNYSNDQGNIIIVPHKYYLRFQQLNNFIFPKIHSIVILIIVQCV